MASKWNRKSNDVYDSRARKRRRAGPAATLLSRLRSVYGFIAVAVVGGLFALTSLDLKVPSPERASASSAVAGRATVIDGDTLEIHGERIRLHGIDAPESRQTCRDESGHDYRCGQRAAQALSEKIGPRPVSCDRRDVDRYGRIVAVCRSGGEDLNGWLVSEGWAVAYRRYSTRYVPMEDAARSARRGIWVGTFLPPERWRQQ